MTLSKVEPGNEVTLRSIKGGRRLKAKLYSMGLVPGTKLYILNQRHCGPIMLRVRDSSIVLGHGMAEKITVE